VETNTGKVITFPVAAGEPAGKHVAVTSVQTSVTPLITNSGNAGWHSSPIGYIQCELWTLINPHDLQNLVRSLYGS